jgi:hypothetical protein
MKILGEDVVFSNNILILDRLEILSDYRGEELGLRFIKAAVRRYGIGCRLVAIKPYPLQHESTDRERDEWHQQMALCRKISAYRLTNSNATMNVPNSRRCAAPNL